MADSLHLLGKHQPDLILVDTDLPDMESCICLSG